MATKLIRTVVFVALGAIAASVLGLLIWKPPESSSDAAAWAQAATAAGAIVAALFAVVWQHQLQAKRDERTEKIARGRRLEVAHQLAAYTIAITKRCIDLCSPGQIPDIDQLEKALGELHTAGESFAKYRAEDFPKYQELEPLLATIAIRNAIDNRVSDACKRGRQHAVGDHLRTSLQEFLQELTPRVEQLRELADTSG